MLTFRRTLALLSILAFAAGAAAAQPEVLQPVENQRGLQLLVDQRRAWVTEPGESARAFRLRRGEIAIAIAELADGWIATGMTQEDEARGLFLARGRGRQVRRLRAPGDASSPFRVRPLPLVAGGQLVGLAWLEGEGPRQLAVKAAAWTGAGWGRTETVAEPGPGSQTGLTAAVLDDGAWMLAWSAWDGRDDDVLFAVRRDGAWSRPRGLHANNRVPDITPSLVATPGGALAAWSRIEDDEYRVHLARYQQGQWETPEPAAGPGTVFPGFVRFGGPPFLLYREARQAAWGLAELTELGEIRRSASSALAAASRPAVEVAAGGEMTLRTPEDSRSRPVRWEFER